MRLLLPCLCLICFSTISFGIRTGQLSAADAPQAKPAAAPRLLIQGWLDREWVSDLYIYDLQGNRQKRLTDKPLPNCDIQAISPDDLDVAFVANAGALHVLSLRHEVLSTLHAGPTGAVAFSRDSSAAAFVVPADGERATTIHVKPSRAGSPIAKARVEVAGDVRGLAFAPDGKSVLYVSADPKGGDTSIRELNLQNGASVPLLETAGCSYRLASFSPDGGQLLAIKEASQKRLCSVMAVSWPAREVKVLATFAAGRHLNALAFAEGGKRIAFLLEDAPGVMNADGTNWKALAGPLPLDPVPGVERSIEKRAIPDIAPGRPLHAAGPYVARVLHDEAGMGRVEVFDLNTGRSTIVNVGKGSVQRALLLE